MRARLAALAMAGALAVTACGTGIANEDAAGDGGLGSGIGVEGSWTIDVYEEDGTLAHHAAFHNDLTEFGEWKIDNLLSREASAGLWAISLSDSTNGATQPCATAELNSGCFITEPGFNSFPDENDFETLTLDAADPEDTTVVLSGSATPTSTAEIDIVETDLGMCTPDVAPSDCTAGLDPGEFQDVTWVNISTLDWDGDGTANDGPIPVTAGQTVQVTVELSFGTL